MFGVVSALCHVFVWIEKREIEDQVSNKRVHVGGRNSFEMSHWAKKSVARALENQLISIFTQIYTGIQHPVDIVPTDYNHCTASIFGSARGTTKI